MPFVGSAIVYSCLQTIGVVFSHTRAVICIGQMNHKPILTDLIFLYAGGGSMTENIDKAGGEGTGAFAKQVIDMYLSRL